MVIASLRSPAPAAPAAAASLPRNLGTRRPRFTQPNGDRLFAARHFLARPSRSQRAVLSFVHRAFDFPRCLLSVLRHDSALFCSSAVLRLTSCRRNANAALAPPLHGCAATVDPDQVRFVNALSLLAHEFRTPASIVSGYLRFLQHDANGLSSRQRQMVDQAGRACGRLLELLQEIGELTAVESGAPMPAPMGVAVFEVCRDALSLGAQGAAPPFLCGDDAWPAMVDGDEARLKRAFAALIAATTREHGSEPLECHGFIDDNGGAPSAVVAFGPKGLAADRERLVTSRTTFDRWRGGTGLSLPIACRIIEAHGGSIWSPGGAYARASAWSLPLANTHDRHFLHDRRG
jgi:signal transduction histidine kinase